MFLFSSTKFKRNSKRINSNLNCYFKFQIFFYRFVCCYDSCRWFHFVILIMGFKKIQLIEPNNYRFFPFCFPFLSNQCELFDFDRWMAKLLCIFMHAIIEPNRFRRRFQETRAIEKTVKNAKECGQISRKKIPTNIFINIYQ